MATKPESNPPEQTYFLFDKIDSDSAKSVCEWIVENNIAKVKHPFITLVINSEGGDLSAAFSIIDMMNSSTISIVTIGMGEIASAGLMVFINGSNGSRTVTPNTSIMSHRFSAGFDGKYHELQAMTKEFYLINERMTNHFMRCTGMSKKDVEKHLLQGADVFMTPQQALDFKLTDTVSLVSFPSKA